MNREEITSQMISLLKEKGKVEDAAEIDLSAAIDSYLNSITYIQFLIAIEEEFDFELGDEELDPKNFTNFYDVVERIYERLNN